MKIKKFQSKSDAQKHLSTKEKLNPFEVHINHSKHKILGQKSKDDHGLPGVSRGKAYRKREKTLLNEYKNRYKSGSFLDMRIGEKNRFLDPEKKIMMRLAAEKKRQFSKKSLFNLNDDEQLTHGGEVLNEVTMKDQSAFSDEDDDDDMIDANIVREQHFGGEMLTRRVDNIGANNNTFTKSRKERIEEMIMASKKKKEETKKEKEIHQDAVSKLDAKFQQFLTLMKGKTMTDEDKERSKKTCEFKEYDMYVKELAFDRSKRAKPTDRLKTEEELVREEKERLKKLEEDRQRRMRGEIQATQQSMMSADALDDCWEKPKMKKRDEEEDTDDGVKFGWNGYTKCDGSKAKSVDEETEDDSDKSGENESEDEEDSEVDENESEIDKNEDESVIHEENESDVSENEEGSKVDDEDNESKEDENDFVADEENESEIIENEAGSDVEDVDNESEEDKSEEFIVDENDCDISETEEESKVENEGNASEEDKNEDESVIDEGNESEIKDNEDGSEIEDEDNEPEVDESVVDGNECEDDESVVDEDGNECEIMENEDSSEVEDEDNEPEVDEDEENAFEISENEEGTNVEDEDNESDKDKNEDESVVNEENDGSEVEDEDNEPEVDKCEDDNSVVIEEGNECELMENDESEVEDEDNEPEVDEDEENESELSENEESFEVEEQDGSEVEENENGKLLLADNEENDGNSEDENDSEEYSDNESEAVEDEDNEYATGENEHEREDGSVGENEDSLSEVESKENSSEVDNDNDESQAGEDNEDEREVDENDDSVGNAENEYEDEDESAAVYENDGSAVEDSGNEAERENENCNKSEVEENDSDSKGSESETERNEGNVSEESMSGIDENDTDVDEDKVEETESEIEGENDINQPSDSDESETEHEHYDDKTQWKKSHNSKYDSEDQSDDLDSVQDLEKLSIKTCLENYKDLRIRNKNTKKKKRKSKEKYEKSKAEEELPYTFEVPPEFDDFWELMQDRTPQQVSTIIERMITCNHPSLGADNKEKSNTIFAYLLQTLHIICGVDPESIKGDIHPLNYVDSLVPHLYTLTQLNPPDSGSAVSQVIDEKYEDCTKKDICYHYPNGDTFIFLKLSGLLFPSSDYRHDVMTRVLTFLTQILGEARVKCGRDLVGLLFTASLLFEYLKRSCRFVAELTNALHAVLYFSIPATEAKLTLPHTHPFKATGPASDLLVLNQPCRTFSSPKLTFSLLNETVELSSDFKIKILNEALLLLNKVCQIWINLSAVRSIFSTTSKLLINLPLDNYPNDTKSLVQSLQTSISNLPRQVPHLVKPESKLRVLRMIDPAIEEVVEGVKKRGGNKQLQERNKLLHKIRRERKGAKRELKRDAEFLARQQLREVLQSDAERKRKVNMIMHGLATQESEYKKFKRSK